MTNTAFPNAVPMDGKPCVVGLFLALGFEADGFSRFFFLFDQLFQVAKNLFDALVVIGHLGVKFIHFDQQVLVGNEHFPEFSKHPHDMNINCNGSLTIQYT